MTSQSDLDILKDIPGYKAILKSVLKSQIQLLIEQLADHTGEESIILTASVHDGALSHLGSSTGKGFLEGRDEIKSQFLGYCLNTHHRKRSEPTSSPYHREKSLMQAHSSKRPRIRKMPYSMSPSGQHTQITSPTSLARTSSTDVNSFSQNSGMHLSMDSLNQSDNFLDNSRTIGQSEETVSDMSQQETAEENGSIPLVKKEPGENEEDVVLTGVEMGENSLSSETWGQEYGSKDDNNTGGDQSGYNSSEQAQNDVQASEPLGGIAFPGLDNVRYDFTSGTTKHLPEISPTELKQALYPEGLSYIQGEQNYRTIQIDSSILESARKFSCAVCQKPFVSRSHLSRHELIHTGEKPFECDLCGVKFTQKSSLNIHYRKHTGETPFPCLYCERSFRSKNLLNSHCIVKHNDKTYEAT